MARKNATELGQRRTAVRRPGVEGFPGWGGMVLKGDPGAVPANRLRFAQNCRFGAGGGIGGGGTVGARGGVSLLNGAAFDGTPIGLYDFQSARPYALWFVADGCPGISSSVGFSVNSFDHETNGKVNRGVYYNSATTQVTIAKYSGNMYISVDGVLKLMALIRPGYAYEGLGVAGYEQAESIATFAGSIITCMREFDGKLFIGTNDGAGSGRILTWDGLSFSLDLTLAATYIPRHFALWRDKLVVGFDATPGGIRVRNVGAAPGTWGSAVAGAMRPYQSAEYRDVLYLSGGSTKVWQYDGATFTAARTIAGAFCYGLATFDECLYYGYKSSASHAIIGKYNGATTTWTDIEKDLYSQFGDLNPSTPRVMSWYRGALVVACLHPATGAMFYLSPTTDTDGTWTRQYINATAVGDVVQMEKY